MQNMNLQQDYIHFKQIKTIVNMKKYHFLIITILLAIVSCRDANNNNGENNIVYVKAGEAREQTVRFPVRSAGRLAAKSEQKLSFRTGGIIKKVHVNAGQEVRQGQILTELNLQEIQAQVNMAKESYQKANRDLQRIQNLYNDSVATLASLQDAQTALSVAKSNLEIAEFNLRYSKIAAPANGKIMRVLMEENEIVAPGYPVMMFGSTQQQWVIKVNVADKDMVAIEPGDSASIALDPYPEQTFVGIVTEIAGMADPFTGTFEIEITLQSDKGKKISSGMIARVNIVPQRTEQLIALPVDALFNIIERTGFIFVIKDTALQKRKVHIERIEDPYVFVTGQVKDGELVVTEGTGFIDVTSKIKVKEIQSLSVDF